MIRRSAIALAPLILLIGAVELRAQRGSVVINEIMYSPFGENDPAGPQTEYVELYNRSGEVVDLTGWVLTDRDTSEGFAFPSGSLPLQPGGYAVVADDTSLLEFFGPLEADLVLGGSGFPTLNNTFDTVHLFDPAFTVVDCVAYAASWGGGRGISLERINPNLGANDTDNWGSCVLPVGGTPGAKNSIYTSVTPSRVTLDASPNPFSPDGDGRDDVTIISYALSVPPATVTIIIYDVRGRLIRRLRRGEPSGPTGYVIWDGLDDRGQSLRIGVYIVFLEATSGDRGVVDRAKTTVVLARRL